MMMPAMPLVEAVQIKFLGEKHRRPDPQDESIGRIALVPLPHGVGPGVGAALRGQNQDFSRILLGPHEALPLTSSGL